ncbi:MAG: Obg family GTPase CgtA, partial [Ruthenibacterium sp.]
RDPQEDFEKINQELARFSAQLAQRPQFVLGNKCDIATPEQIEAFRAFIEGKGLVFLPVSAATRQGLDKLPGMVYERLQTLPPIVMYEPEYIRPDLSLVDARAFTVTREDEHAWRVEAPFLVRILESADVDDYESLQYFQKQLADSGVLDQLVEMGVEEDDTIRIDDFEFDYVF